MGDDVFRLNELVNSYWVASSNNLEEKSNFCIAKNTFVDVDIEELNDALRTSRHTQVYKDDNNDEINIEDCDGYNDDEIEEENSD